jgi:hypothetical protein
MTRKLQPHVRPQCPTREKKEAKATEDQFWTHCDLEEIEAANAVEDRVLDKRQKTRPEEIIQEASNWMPDPGNPHTRDTKYFQMVEAYWMNKALVAQAITETQRQNVELLQAVHILEGKFELFCHSQHGIKFRVNQPTHSDGGKKIVGLPGTQRS